MSSTEKSLPEEVRIALEAYQQMGQTKTTYFNLLLELDQKYSDSGEPSIAENLQLEKYLKAHDENVAAFNKAMQAVTEPKAREQLLQKLTSDKMPGKH